MAKMHLRKSLSNTPMYSLPSLTMQRPRLFRVVRSVSTLWTFKYRWYTLTNRWQNGYVGLRETCEQSSHRFNHSLFTHLCLSLTSRLPFPDDEFDHVHIEGVALAVPEHKVCLCTVHTPPESVGWQLHFPVGLSIFSKKYSNPSLVTLAILKLFRKWIVFSVLEGLLKWSRKASWQNITSLLCGTLT